MRSAWIALVALWTIAPPPDAAAQLPATDVFVMEMPGEPLMEAPAATNLTRRNGYDNQPRFSPDGRYLYITSIWEDGQADVYRIALDSRVRSRVTFTSQSEYSPTPREAGFDVVRVEDDGTQRIWRFAEDGRSAEMLLPRLAPVGYFAWLDDQTVAAFIVGEPHALVIAQTGDQTVDTVATNIGRAVAVVPGRNAVSYVQKRGGDAWSIDMFDLDSGKSGTITPTLPGREDFAWTPDGRLLMADGPVIYVWSSGAGTWEQFVDLGKSEEVGDISRLAVSPTGNLLAFVAERAR